MIRNGEIDEIDLFEYVTDNDINLAIAVAGCDSATEAILDIAAHDKDSTVRKAAINNENIGVKTLQYLLRKRKINGRK